MIPPEEFERLIALLNRGKLKELELAAQGLTERYPLDGRGWQLLGVSFLSRELNWESLAPLVHASELMPRNAAIWDNLGLAHFRLGDYIHSDQCFRSSLALQPDRVSAWVNRSACACSAGEASSAERYASRAIELQPNSPSSHLSLGNALTELGRLDQAEACYLKALRLRPDWDEAELSLGALYERSGRLHEAAACFAALVAKSPANWKAHTNLGRVFSGQGRTSLAVASFGKALECNPGALEARSGMLFLSLHDEDAEPRRLFDAHRAFGDLVEAAYRPGWGGWTNTRDPLRRLRVGFVSGDLRSHAVAFFLEPLFKEFDHGQLEIFVYSNHPVEDEITGRLKPCADSWQKVIGLSDDQLAGRIRDDAVDILVDLSGHTAYNRLAMFARKPAPIQASWLGYPATTGLTAIDYRPIHGVTVVPGKLDAQFTEKLVYLSCASPFQPSPEAPDVAPLPALSRGYVTFGSLNRPSKLGGRVIALWSRILRTLPESRLLIGAISEDAWADTLAEGFLRHGIGRDRLSFHPRLPMKEYLALHHEIDIMLDCFPYSAGTTSNHAVWMGVPVLTLVGATLAQRLGAVAMSKAGLPDWVLESEDDYVRKAVCAAADLAGLAELRARIRDDVRASPLGQPARYARCMEAAYREMWRRWCAGDPPVGFEVRL